MLQVKNLPEYDLPRTRKDNDNRQWSRFRWRHRVLPPRLPQPGTLGIGTWFTDALHLQFSLRITIDY
jgi:hypothetical protein